MPKDEFDFEDPLELKGVAFPTDQDTTDAMSECFIEEFMRMGHNAKQILALFRNPQYLGMNMVLEKRGEQFVRDQITEIFARWGRPAVLPAPFDDAAPVQAALTDPSGAPLLPVNH